MRKVVRMIESRRYHKTGVVRTTGLNGMAMVFPVAATRRQIFVVEFVVVCCRFFFYHEALSALPLHRIKAFASPVNRAMCSVDSPASA
jgi:hypothetical protein